MLKKIFWIFLVISVGSFTLRNEIGLILANKISVNRSISPMIYGVSSNSLYGIVESNSWFINDQNLPYALKNDSIRIYVDTTTILPVLISPLGISTDRLEIVESYPVYLVNNSSDSQVLLAYEDWLVGTLLAKNKDGIWTEIEASFQPSCGLGINLYELKPKDWIMTKIPIYEGGFETEIKLKTSLGESNSYFGKINESQFVIE